MQIRVALCILTLLQAAHAKVQQVAALVSQLGAATAMHS